MNCWEKHKGVDKIKKSISVFINANGLNLTETELQGWAESIYNHEKSWCDLYTTVVVGGSSGVI